MTTEIQLTFDCGDPATLAGFWCDVLGYVVQSPPPGFDSWEQALEAFGVPPEHRNDASAAVDPEGVGPRLFFQKVPEGKTAKNRLHLDVRAAPGLEGEERMSALEARCEQLVRDRRHEARASRALAADGRRTHRHAGPGGQRVLPGLIPAGLIGVADPH